MQPLFRKDKLTWFAVTGVIAALLAVTIAVLSGVGSRLAWWHFGFGFTLLKWAVYIAMAATVISVLGMIAARPGSGKKGLLSATAGFVIAVLVIVIPLLWKQIAQELPPIHDITTNTESPPQFFAIVSLRQNAANPLEYAGVDVAKQQEQAYPDIKPFVVDIAPADLFDAALVTVRDLGWEVVAAVKEDMRIEATDTTFWFGFKDDVVIRISAHNDGSELNIRSVSRVGKSDVGTNADRIRSYLAKLKAKLNV